MSDPRVIICPVPLFALPLLLAWVQCGLGQAPDKAPAALPVADETPSPVSTSVSVAASLAVPVVLGSLGGNTGK